MTNKERAIRELVTAMEGADRICVITVKRVGEMDRVEYNFFNMHEKGMYILVDHRRKYYAEIEAGLTTINNHLHIMRN